jgi:rRNA-processing protein FCF1
MSTTIEELKELVRLCTKKPDSKGFLIDKNYSLVIRIERWLEDNVDKVATDKRNIKDVAKLREFVEFHKSVTSSVLPQEIPVYLVIDTNIFFHCDDILERLDKNCKLVLPQIVLDELRNHVRKNDAKGRQSKQILYRIDSFPASRKVYQKADGAAIHYLTMQFEVETPNDKCDVRILLVAKQLKKEKKQVTLLSDDNELRNKAAELHITTLSLRDFFAE